MARSKQQAILAEAIELADNLPVLPDLDLSMGCDIFDLMISGEVGKAMGPGRFLWYHGPSGSGKSYHTKVLLAEAANNPAYDNHRLVIFDGEHGSNFNTEEFFGHKLASRLECMEATSLDHLYDALDTLVKQPVVVAVDSWDSWMTHAAMLKIQEDMKKRAEDKVADGTYAMDHGKVHSNRLRLLIPNLAKTNSILIGVSQHRDNVNKANPYSPKDVVPGGRALKFWCTNEIETQLKGKLEKTVNGNKFQVGDVVEVRVLKNRTNGFKVPFELEFYPSFGTDNLGSSIRWLENNKYVSQSSGRYSIPFYEKTYFKEDLIAKIEAEGREGDLQQLLSNSWQEWMQSLQIERKPRYS
jgi:hypothetical protein